MPESGAVLLDLRLGSGAPPPDELRVWVYDDAGTLWSNVRFPSEGALAAPRGSDLGTILIQPGPVTGRLRIHAQAMMAGARALDGTLAMTPGTGSAALELDVALPEDSDGDGVPDDIDDCVAAANPDQGGCVADSDGGSDAATTDDGGACEGPCGQPAGSACGLDADCASGFCADGVCCETACLGTCRSCNQPNADGVCMPYKVGTDPERECGDTSCNGAGACGAPPAPTNKTNGSTCTGGAECASGFCTDGVCCPEACDAPCLSCATGSCTAVKNRADSPQCVSPMTCNVKGKCV